MLQKVVYQPLVFDQHDTVAMNAVLLGQLSSNLLLIFFYLTRLHVVEVECNKDGQLIMKIFLIQLLW